MLTFDEQILRFNWKRRTAKKRVCFGGDARVMQLTVLYDEADDDGSVVAINHLLVYFLLLQYCVFENRFVAYVLVCVCVCVCRNTKVQGPRCQNKQTVFTTARSAFRSEARDEADKKLKCKKYVCKRDCCSTNSPFIDHGTKLTDPTP